MLQKVFHFQNSFECIYINVCGYSTEREYIMTSTHQNLKYTCFMRPSSLRYAILALLVKLIFMITRSWQATPNKPQQTWIVNMLYGTAPSSSMVWGSFI